MSKAMHLERISAVTLRVLNMARAVTFYSDILGLEVLYGGKESSFSSLRTSQETDAAILNLEEGQPSPRWGRVIFYVRDVDEFWAYVKSQGFNPPQPQDAGWGERYFPMHDPDGHELSFAKPLS